MGSSRIALLTLHCACLLARLCLCEHLLENSKNVFFVPPSLAPSRPVACAPGQVPRAGVGRAGPWLSPVPATEEVDGVISSFQPRGELLCSCERFMVAQSTSPVPPWQLMPIAAELDICICSEGGRGESLAGRGFGNSCPHGYREPPRSHVTSTAIVFTVHSRGRGDA